MMRCITAIWPAGPPKLSAATRTQTQNASMKLTPWEGVEGCPASAATIPVRLMSGPRLLRRPVVGFVHGIPTPTIEGVVKCHAGFELLKVVGIHARQAERGGQKSRGLGG